jgi:hypothetical protein
MLIKVLTMARTILRKKTIGRNSKIKITVVRSHHALKDSTVKSVVGACFVT